METKSINKQQKNFYAFPDEIVRSAIARLRNAKYKYTVAGTIRAEVKNLPEDDKSIVTVKLRTASYMTANLDIAKYLNEVIN